MKTKTAIRQLIELLEKHIDWIEGNHKAERVDIYDVSAKAHELESVNEQQIKDAANFGKLSMDDNIRPENYKTTEQYFNETFESHDNRGTKERFTK